MIIFHEVDKFRLQKVDFHVPRGTCVGIIGASGSGKTTLLKLAAGLLEPEGGMVYTDRRNPVQNRLLAHRLGVLFGDIPMLDERVILKDSLEELRGIYGIEPKEFAKRLKYAAGKLDFADFLEATPKQMSLGQKRRAELGILFCREPQVYLMDDPCTGLDQNAKAAFYELVCEKKREGATFLVSSHNMEELLQVVDRILVLDRGSVAFYGEKDQLYKQLAPMDRCYVEFEGSFPDISELEIEEYRYEPGKLMIRYNSNHVSSKEICEKIMASSVIKSVNIRKADLAEGIRFLMEQGEEK